MGKGRTLGHAMRSRVSPPAGMRWVAPANAHARCVGNVMRGQRGGDPRNRFTSASKRCAEGVSESKY
jgi:hypothetical protein